MAAKCVCKRMSVSEKGRKREGVLEDRREKEKKLFCQGKRSQNVPTEKVNQ